VAYIADAARLRSGSIVKVEKPLSSSGRPTYPHFFIVLTVPESIKPGDEILLVGISSRIDPRSADPAKHIAMKWNARKGGDPETGFSRPSYASVDFTYVLQVYRGETFQLEVEAEFTNKFIRADKLQTVAAAMNAWSRRPRPHRPLDNG
jgi:hypothetical protein